MASADAELGERIKGFRTRKGLSQGDLADRMTELGFPMQQQTILKIEKGTRSIKLTEAAAMAAALDISVEWMAPTSEAQRAANAVRSLALELRRKVQSATEELARAEEMSAELATRISELSEEARTFVPDVSSRHAGRSAEQLFTYHLDMFRQVMRDPEAPFHVQY